MNAKISIPFYVKGTLIILGIIGLFFILFIGQGVIVPLLFSLIIAILLNPIVNYLIRKNINHVVAILISISLTILVLALLIYFITSQVIMFGDMLPTLKEKIDVLTNQGISWASQAFNISTAKINGWIAEMKKESVTAGKAFIGPTIISIGGAIAILLLLPVFVFLILFHKQLFLEFIGRLFNSENHNTVSEILTESKSLIQTI